MGEGRVRSRPDPGNAHVHVGFRKRITRLPPQRARVVVGTPGDTGHAPEDFLVGGNYFRQGFSSTKGRPRPKARIGY